MKRKLENAQDLKQAITELEIKAASQKIEIQESVSIISENLKPANLVKSGVQSVFSGNHTEELRNVLIGLATGFISRKLLLRKSNGFVKKTLGNVIQWGITGLVSKNAELIKEKAGVVIDRFFKKHKKDANHWPESKEPNQ